MNAHHIASVILNAKGLEDVPRGCLARSESTMNTTIGNHGAMLSGKLEAGILMLLQRCHQELGLIPYFVCGVGAETSERAALC